MMLYPQASSIQRVLRWAGSAPLHLAKTPRNPAKPNWQASVTPGVGKASDRQATAYRTPGPAPPDHARLPAFCSPCPLCSGLPFPFVRVLTPIRLERWSGVAWAGSTMRRRWNGFAGACKRSHCSRSPASPSPCRVSVAGVLPPLSRSASPLPARSPAPNSAVVRRVPEPPASSFSVICGISHGSDGNVRDIGDSRHSAFMDGSRAGACSRQ